MTPFQNVKSSRLKRELLATLIEKKLQETLRTFDWI
jgi:hypothetical protein